MRLCRFVVTDGSPAVNERPRLGFYTDEGVRLIPFDASDGTGHALLHALPGGSRHQDALHLFEHIDELPLLDFDRVRLLVPVPKPPKLLLLAGNYAKHVEERGGVATEREETFPYVFMKPPSTTLIASGEAIRIPKCSPDQIDWELELGVVIGRSARNVAESEALSVVAGYTVINDISDRSYTPNPDRRERDRDRFFDWLHGKWHDSFCPMGPCVLSADEVADPQDFALRLRRNGNVEQAASTAEMIFPVAALIAFISRSITLEPGDVIATGTPSGVGKAKGIFLQPGDEVEAEIDRIGTLVNPVVMEER